MAVLEFIETPAFTRYLENYLLDDAYRLLQHRLAINPESGRVMPGTGGFRKLRWSDSRRNKGSRGGLRIIYFYFPAERQIWLMTIFGKDEATDLSEKEKQELKTAIDRAVASRRSRKTRR